MFGGDLNYCNADENFCAAWWKEKLSLLLQILRSSCAEINSCTRRLLIGKWKVERTWRAELLSFDASREKMRRFFGINFCFRSWPVIFHILSQCLIIFSRRWWCSLASFRGLTFFGPYLESGANFALFSRVNWVPLGTAECFVLSRIACKVCLFCRKYLTVFMFDSKSLNFKNSGIGDRKYSFILLAGFRTNKWKRMETKYLLGGFYGFVWRACCFVCSVLRLVFFGKTAKAESVM